MLIDQNLLRSALAYFLSLQNISTTLLEKEFIGSGSDNSVLDFGGNTITIENVK